MRALDRGVNRGLYWLGRAIVQPVLHVYFRMRRSGMEHVPKSGPVIFAANHRSFVDPFVIGTLTRRPVYYLAKKELFLHPVAGWLMSRLGGFPIDRGGGDVQAMETARRILERGDCPSYPLPCWGRRPFGVAGACARIAYGSAAGVRSAFRARTIPRRRSLLPSRNGYGPVSCCNGTGLAGRCRSARCL